MIKGTSKNIVCDKACCDRILGVNGANYITRKGEKGQTLHYCPEHDPGIQKQISCGQPIVIHIHSTREKKYKQADPVELFDSINRAFEFNKYEHEFIKVYSCFGDPSYKEICRMLVAESRRYKIIKIYVAIIKGGWPRIIYKKGIKSAINIQVNEKSINGNRAQKMITVSVKKGQAQKRVALEEEEDGFFYLDGVTKLTIPHINPGSQVALYFYPEINPKP